MKQQDNILAILPHSIGGRLTINSIVDGFIALGYDVKIYDDIYDTDFSKKYDSIKPEYLLGYDFSAINLIDKNNISAKCINYFSDKIHDPHSGENFDKLYPRLKDSNNISFYWDKDLLQEENNQRISYLPHFVNTDVYKNLNLDKKHDIMFMGRLDTQYRLETFLNILKNYENCAYYSIEKHFQDAISRCNNDDKELLKKAYKGFIDNENDMSKAINEAKVIINFNEQGVSSLNYRTIQTFACGTIHLSDYRGDGVKFFDDRFFYYENEKEILDKLNYCFKNFEILEKNAKEIRKIVEEKFSHRAGVLDMITFINKLDF